MVNSQAVIEVMRRVAAAEILPRFGRLGASDVSEKSRPGDLVTVADVEAERRLAEALTELVRGSLVVGEEGAEADPAVLGVLAGEAPVWLIDPVDGTANFARGTPCFAVIVGFVERGETVAGWILDPLSGRVVRAIKGEGAWLEQKDGGAQRLRIRQARPIEAMTGSLGGRLRRQLAARTETGLSQGPARLVRYGCVGREYMDLALGVLDFAQYGRLKPWDHAAGVLIHAEAGGFARLTESGEAYRPQPRIQETRLLLAPDETSWRTLRALFAEAEGLPAPA